MLPMSDNTALALPTGSCRLIEDFAPRDPLARLEEKSLVAGEFILRVGDRAVSICSFHRSALGSMILMSTGSLGSTSTLASVGGLGSGERCVLNRFDFTTTKFFS